MLVSRRRGRGREGSWDAIPSMSFGFGSESPEPPEETEHLLGSGDTSAPAASDVMEARAEHQKTKNYRLLYGLTTAFGVTLLTAVLFWCFHYRGGFAWHSDPSLEFNWHPLLMTAGMIFIYGQSALIYRTQSSSPKKTVKIWHALLHFSAFVLAVVGLKAVFDSHNLAKDPMPNLYSLHSWIGLTTVIIFTGQLIFGFACFLFPGLSKTLRSAALPVHVAVGTATFTAATIAAMLGFSEKAIFSVKDYQTFPGEGVLINFLGVLLAIFSLMVLYLLNETAYKRVAQPEDEVTLTESNE